MAGPLLLGGAVHRRHLRVVRAQGGAAPHHGARHHHADGAALARARHRGHRDLQHDVRHPRRRHGHESGKKCSSPDRLHFGFAVVEWLLIISSCAVVDAGG